MGKPVIMYDSKGASGHIFWLLAETRKALTKESGTAGLAKFEVLQRRVFSAKRYEDALEIIGEAVELVDMSI